MGQQDLALLLQWKKKQFLKFNEILSLTEQMAESIDRNDRFSVNMLLGMREDPIRQAQEIQEQIGEYLYRMPEQEAVRANELLTGAENGQGMENALSGQAAQNRRLLDRIINLDKFISQRLGGNRSFYATFREG